MAVLWAVVLCTLVEGMSASEAADTFEIFINFYQITRHCIPEAIFILTFMRTSDPTKYMYNFN
jgi:hypothetical protein